MYKIISNTIYMTDIVDNNIRYRLNENDKTASVLGLANPLKDIIIPESITSNNVSYNVISIEEKAFKNSLIESITIPNTIKIIGEDAFYYADNLKYIYFNCEKPTIGDSSFHMNNSPIFSPTICYVDVDKYPSWKGINKIGTSVYINKQGYYKVLIKFVLMLLLFFLLFSLNVYYFFISHKSLTNMLTIVPLLILPIISFFIFNKTFALLTIVILFLTIIINTLVKSNWSLITRLPMALLLVPSGIMSNSYL